MADLARRNVDLDLVEAGQASSRWPVCAGLLGLLEMDGPQLNAKADQLLAALREHGYA